MVIKSYKHYLAVKILGWFLLKWAGLVSFWAGNRQPDLATLISISIQTLRLLNKIVVEPLHARILQDIKVVTLLLLFFLAKPRFR